MRLAARTIRRWLALAAAGVGAAGCVLVSSTTTIHQLSRDASAEQRPAMRAHMANGDVVSFAHALVTPSAVVGRGTRLNAVRRDRRIVDSIPLDSVLGLETYVRTVNRGRTWLYAPTTLALTTVGTYAFFILAIGGDEWKCESGCSAWMTGAPRRVR